MILCKTKQSCIRAVRLIMEDLIFVFVGNEKPSKDKIKPIENKINYGFDKPNGGFWSSPISDDGKNSEWEFFCKEEGMSNEFTQRWFIKPDEDCRILIVNNNKDLEKYRKDERVNFEKLAKEYDAIFLTKEGAVNTQQSLMWDFSSCLFLHPKFKIKPDVNYNEKIKSNNFVNFYNKRKCDFAK